MLAHHRPVEDREELDLILRPQLEAWAQLELRRGMATEGEKEEDDAWDMSVHGIGLDLSTTQRTGEFDNCFGQEDALSPTPAPWPLASGMFPGRPPLECT